MGKPPAANRTQDVLVAREFRTEAEKLPWHTTGNQRRTKSYVSEVLLAMWREDHREVGLTGNHRGTMNFIKVLPPAAHHSTVVIVVT